MSKGKLRLKFQIQSCVKCLWLYIFIDHSWCSSLLAGFNTPTSVLTFFFFFLLGTNTCISWREVAREEKLTVSGGLVLVLGGVGTVSSRRAGAHAEDVPGGWFQTRDDHARSLGSS